VIFSLFGCCTDNRRVLYPGEVRRRTCNALATAAVAQRQADGSVKKLLRLL